MSTPKHTPTPYDAEIDSWAGPTQHGHIFDHLVALQEGYLRCQASYAPLLEAATLALRLIETAYDEGRLSATMLDRAAAIKLRAAIAPFEEITE